MKTLQFNLSTQDLNRLAEAYDWATNKMLNNPDMGAMWDHYDHFISGLGWTISPELLVEINKFYDYYKHMC